MEGLLLFLGTTIGAVVMILFRRPAAARDVDRFLERSGLPAEAELIAATFARFERRQVVIAVGAWVGSVAGIAIFVRLDAGATALAWWMAAGITGVAIAICVLHIGAVRADGARGPRAASLRQRRLLDFLSPTYVALQYGFLLLPLLTGSFGLRIVLGQGDAALGWALIAAAGGAVLIVAGATVLQRWMLQVNQPAGQAVELRWSEAIRAMMLRDLASVMVGASWALGGSVLATATAERPAEFPASMEWISFGLQVVGVFVFIWMVGVATTGRLPSRWQQVTQ